MAAVNSVSFMHMNLKSMTKIVSVFANEPLIIYLSTLIVGHSLENIEKYSPILIGFL